MSVQTLMVRTSKFLCLVVLYIITFIVTGAMFAPDEIGGTKLVDSASNASPIPSAEPVAVGTTESPSKHTEIESSEQAMPPGAVWDLLAIIAMAAIDTLLFSVVAAGSTIRRFRLWSILCLLFLGVKGFTSLIEAWFFMPNVDARTAAQLLILWVPLSIIWIGGAVIAFGRTTVSTSESAIGVGFRPPLLGLTRVQWVLRVAFLSAIVYPILFFGFGYFIAWQSAELREFYTQSSEGTNAAFNNATFTVHLGVYLFEVARGVLWVVMAIPILKYVQGRWLYRGMLVGLVFALVQNNVHFLRNPLMPSEVRWWHFWETSSSNLLLGLTIAYVLCVAERQRVPSVASRSEDTTVHKPASDSMTSTMAGN